ncbi:methyltransferase domain-containing protein [Bordetella avium]|nr:methyltransferase domain-containing protein [Bordetella avium]
MLPYFLSRTTMQNWTAGYTVDIPYVHGYYRELNPLWLKQVMLQAGVAFPECGVACELGFGQGLGINIHASASCWQWYGTDFNPEHAAFAQALARESGNPAVLRDDAFDAYAQRDDLPDFDFIALHGILSWISDDNRQVIVDFIRRKLKLGGVVYISYNTLPGWAPFIPLRQLLTNHARYMGHGTWPERAHQALDFTEKLLASDPLYLRAAPLLTSRTQDMRKHDVHYLLHEYFNRDWTPTSFSQLADWMRSAKLDFVCSADPLDQIEALSTTEEQRALLAEVHDRTFYQDVRDLMVSRNFRKDYWVKGPRVLPAAEQSEQIAAQRVILTSLRESISTTVSGGVREATLRESIAGPVLDILQDHKAHRIGELQAQLAGHNITGAQLHETLLILMAAGHLSPAQEDSQIEQTLARTQAINRLILRQAKHNDALQYLANPATGGGFSIDRIARLLILARETSSHPEDWVQATWSILKQNGQRLLKEGEALETEDDNIEHLRSIAQHFERNRLPLLRAMGIL